VGSEKPISALTQAPTSYTSPVSATDGPSIREGEQWPRDKKVEPEDPTGERTEMGAVRGGQKYSYLSGTKDINSFGINPAGGTGWTAPQAPILSHPGNGRGQALSGQPSPPSSSQSISQAHGGLTEDDARKGHAM
jgi:hypothetical protein